MQEIWNLIVGFANETGIAKFFVEGGYKYLIMIVIALVLMFLAIKKRFEPYLLLPIAFGMLLVNIPGVKDEVFIETVKYTINYAGEVFSFNSQEAATSFLSGLVIDYQGNTLPEIIESSEEFKVIVTGISNSAITLPENFAINGSTITATFDSIENANAFLKGLDLPVLDNISEIQAVESKSYSGLIGYLYYGVKYGIYPCLIFLCIGATTDFGPLIANKKTMLLGAAAQIGIFLTFILAKNIFGFSLKEAASISIIAGADGPTAILVTSKMAPELLGPISIAAYSYMALIPMIFPPIVKLLTTKKERSVKMVQEREVSKKEKIMFPIIVAIVVILIVPSCAPLIGCLMLGNLVKESNVVPKITETLSGPLLYTITILLGVCVGATASAENFLNAQTIYIFILGISAFVLSAASGLLFGKVMYWFSKGKINPLIGAAGVSAVPMAARVVHNIGKKENPDNFLLMHAMGPNVAGVIGSAVAAGILMILF